MCTGGVTSHVPSLLTRSWLQVQSVRTFANPLETIGGAFSLEFDTTASGGGVYVSAFIPNAALASRGAWTD